MKLYPANCYQGQFGISDANTAGHTILRLITTAMVAYLCSACGPNTDEQQTQIHEDGTVATQYFCAATVLDFNDPLGPAVIRPGSLFVVDEGKITSVLTGEAASNKSTDVQCTDLGGRIVIPGLIDAHAHVTFQNRKPVGCQEIERILKHYLAAGVTTIVDLGASDQGQMCLDRAHRDTVLSTGRRLSASNPGLCNTPVLFFDCPASAEEADLAIANRKVAHRDIVKLYTIGSRGDNIRAALITKAASEGLTVLEHEVSCSKVWRTLSNGDPMANSLAHPPLTQWANWCSQRFGKKFLDALNKQDIGIISTVQIPVNGAHPNPGPAVDFLMLAVKHRVVIGLGTDIDAPGLLGGVPLHDEIALIDGHTGDWELPLRAATIGSAYILGQEQQIGNLRPGKQADFVVLDVRDYGADADRLKKICMVVKAGTILHQGNNCNGL